MTLFVNEEDAHCRNRHRHYTIDQETEKCQKRNHYLLSKHTVLISSTCEIVT